MEAWRSSELRLRLLMNGMVRPMEHLRNTAHTWIFENLLHSPDRVPQVDLKVKGQVLGDVLGDAPIAGRFTDKAVISLRQSVPGPMGNGNGGELCGRRRSKESVS